MKPPAAPVAMVVAALLLGSTWSCHRNREAGPESQSQLPPNVIIIQPGSQEAAGFSFARVRARPLPLTTTEVGSLTVNEDKTDHIGVLFAGVVAEVLAKVGDHVQSGQVLARLHTHDLHDAISAYRTATAEAERTRRLTEYTLHNRERYDSLYQIKFASRQEAEQAAMDYRNAVADSEKAQAMLQASRTHLAEMLEVPEDKISERDLSADTIPIKTPRSGIVMARYVTPGMAVNPGAQTFTVSGLGTLWMMAAVNEETLGGLQIGMPVTIRVRAYPDATFDGQVTQLGPQLDPATRTLTVRVLIPNRDGRLRPEMYATAEIARGGSRSALFVPEVALQKLNGNSVVFVRRPDSEFEARAVKAGARVDGEVEIAEGLKDGEEVVTSGAFVVKSQFLTRSLTQE
jgi:multidrug efflux pump subunit AcrA (membrane-fusion protein)